MQTDTQYWRERCMVVERLYHAEVNKREAAELAKQKAELCTLRMCDIVDQYRRVSHG